MLSVSVSGWPLSVTAMTAHQLLAFHTAPPLKYIIHQANYKACCCVLNTPLLNSDKIRHCIERPSKPAASYSSARTWLEWLMSAMNKIYESIHLTSMNRKCLVLLNILCTSRLYIYKWRKTSWNWQVMKIMSGKKTLENVKLCSRASATYHSLGHLSLPLQHFPWLIYTIYLSVMILPNVSNYRIHKCSQ